MRNGTAATLEYIAIYQIMFSLLYEIAFYVKKTYFFFFQKADGSVAVMENRLHKKIEKKN